MWQYMARFAEFFEHQYTSVLRLVREVKFMRRLSKSVGHRYASVLGLDLDNESASFTFI
jgi:hypothetical protein